MFQIAVIGDLHGQFDAGDVAALNAMSLNLVLFVGDLCHLVSPRQTRAVARRIAGLRAPALAIPGNHDVANVPQILTEMRGRPRLAGLFGEAHPRLHARLREALAPATLAGYSRHAFAGEGLELEVVAGRPYALGGSQCSFAPVLKAAYDVADLDASAARLCRIVDETVARDLIFLAHNGPHGLGALPEDIWGCDFDPERGDFGDRDLSVAIVHARRAGKRVLAVVAGHMHRRSRSGRERTWHRIVDGTHYINAAEVPRWRDEPDGRRRHMVRLEVDGTGVLVEDVWY